MLQQLQWPTLQERRSAAKVIMTNFQMLFVCELMYLLLKIWYFLLEL